MTDEWKTLNEKPSDPQQSIHDLTGKIIASLVRRSLCLGQVLFGGMYPERASHVYGDVNKKTIEIP